MAESQVTHERVDDVPLLMHVLRERLQLDQTLDENLPRHGNGQGLSFGKVTVTWLSHILSEGDHFMSHVQLWANARPETLEQLLGQSVRDTDLTDDRLSEVLRHLSDDTFWYQIESSTNARMIRTYRLPRRQVHVDSTTAKIDKQGVSWLFRHGHSKDHRPDLSQFKVLLAALDPLGSSWRRISRRAMRRMTHCICRLLTVYVTTGRPRAYSSSVIANWHRWAIERTFINGIIFISRPWHRWAKCLHN